MKDDPLIGEVRKARQEISELCGHDPQRLGEYYRKLEKKLRATGKHRFLGDKAHPPKAEAELLKKS